VNDSLEKYKRFLVLGGNKRRMSDRIVLRKVFAIDPDTGLTVTGGKVLLTDNSGGTSWVPMLNTLSITGGAVVGNLPSTISSFSTINYINTTWISTISTTYLAAICSLGAIITAKTADAIIADLGELYISSATLKADLSTLRSDPSTVSTLAPALSTLGFVNLSTLSSFTATQSFSTTSTVIGLGSVGYVSSLHLVSTVIGLGTAGYISSITTPISFQSTVIGLGTSGYTSSITLTSSINGLGTAGFISSSGLVSSIRGLSQVGYVSTGHLVSTTFALSSMKANIRFDNVTTISIIGGENINNFTSIGNLIYVSTFFQSSIAYSGAQPGTQIQGRVIDFVNMEFSTAVLKMDSFSSFIDHKSRVTIEVFPSLSFTKLATGATNVAILPISTLLKYGESFIHCTTTNYMYVGNTKTVLENGLPVDSSNVFNQPIRISIPQGIFAYLDPSGNKINNYAVPYSLYHYMPSSINNGQLQNALHANHITPYFGSTGSIFVTVQNSV
jgi:hypothetical protein